MKMPYLGKIDLRWCSECNVPVLHEICGTCHERTVRVPVTPPGDMRPAFEHDIKVINRAVKEGFGTDLVNDDRIVLLNGVPGIDRFEEIIMDGIIVGALKYHPREDTHEFLPSLEGGQMLWPNASKGYVVVAKDAGEYIIKGRSVLMPGVIGHDPQITQGQQVLVICEDNVIATGMARMSGGEALSSKKGQFVKVRRRKKRTELDPLIPKTPATLKEAVKANEHMLRSLENKAVSFVNSVLTENERPVLVSFSGGKDSLATLLIVRKVVEPKVLFIDTGIEFPETHEYVNWIEEEQGLELIRVEAGDAFWRGMDVFGMSGRDYRWCCKVCKMGPLSRLAEKEFPLGFLTFIGQRRYESQTRAKSGRIWRNSWLPKQLCASPIQDWTALHVWLFLFNEGVRTNPLYEKGFERIGCWLCPSSSMYEFSLMRDIHPLLWGSFFARLRSIGWSENQIDGGIWRWRRPPRVQREENPLVDLDKTPMYGPGTFQEDEGRLLMFTRAGGGPTEGVRRRAALCLGCGVCLGHCQVGALEIIEGRAVINESCVGCGRCNDKCPLVKFIY